MPLTVVTNPEEISKYHEALGKLMRKNIGGKPRPLRITTQGGSWKEPAVYYNSEHNFWWTNDRIVKNNRYYNLIGLDPDFDRPNSILIQINYQIRFRNFKAAAFWGKDNAGNVFLLHNGKMGGNVKGFTYKNIDPLYSGHRSYINGDKFESYTVCELYSPRAYKQVIAFIEEINEVKNKIKNLAAGASKSNFSHQLKKYSPEFWGRRKSYSHLGRISSNSNHGWIVHSLKKELKKNSTKKYEFQSSKYIDLGVVRGKAPVALFEFKTSGFKYAIYTAIGQLMLHSHRANPKFHKFIVLPEDDIDDAMIRDLEGLGIESILFRIKGQAITFKGVDRFLKLETR